MRKLLVIAAPCGHCHHKGGPTSLRFVFTTPRMRGNNFLIIFAEIRGQKHTEKDWIANKHAP